MYVCVCLCMCDYYLNIHLQLFVCRSNVRVYARSFRDFFCFTINA